MVKISIEVGEGAYKDRNEVKAWKVLDGAKKAAAPSAASTAAPTEAAASRSLPPWRKG